MRFPVYLSYLGLILAFVLACSPNMKSPLDLPAATAEQEATNPNNTNVITINGGATATNSTTVTVTVKAKKYTDMYLTFTADCAGGGKWEPIAQKSMTLPSSNATNTIYGKFRVSQNGSFVESTCVSSSIDHDTTTPTVSIDTPPDGSPINAELDSTYLLIGSCSKDGVVYITAPVVTTAVCMDGAWTRTLNLSSQADGDVDVVFYIKSEAGNNSANTSVTYVKDATPPTDGTMVINDDDPTTPILNVTLTLSATDAVEYYVTDDPTCASGGTWEVAAPTFPWTLPTPNATNTIYVKFRDLFQNESSCISDSIDAI